MADDFDADFLKALDEESPVAVVPTLETPVAPSPITPEAVSSAAREGVAATPRGAKAPDSQIGFDDDFLLALGEDTFASDAQMDDAVEAVKTTVKAAIGGGVKGTGLAGGAFMGGRTAFVLSAPGGPFVQLAATLFGATIGGAAGFFSSEHAAASLEELGLAIRDPYSVEEKFRPFAVGGEAFGAGISFLPFQLGIGNSVMRVAAGKTERVIEGMTVPLPHNKVGKFIDSTLDFARDKPIQFMGSELPPLTAAAIAASAYEAIRPGQPMERMGAEIAAGFLNPMRLTISATAKVFGSLKSLVGKMTPAGRRTAAGQQLQKFLQAADDAKDPQVLVRALADNQLIADSIPGFDATAAQLTGDLNLARFEAELGEQDRRLFNISVEKAGTTLRAIANAISLLKQTGDPQALRTAAHLERIRFETMFERETLHLRRQAVEAAERIGQGETKAGRSRLSAEVTTLYTRSLARARSVEAEVWKNALPEPNAPATHRSIQGTFSSLRAELPSAGELPTFIERQVADIAKASNVLRRLATGAKELEDGTQITRAMVRKAQRVTSVGELQRFRRSLLARARAAANGTDDLAEERARQFGIMAEGVMGDMIAAGVATRVTSFGRRGPGGRFIPGEAGTLLDTAMNYTRQLNDVYSRSLIGAAQQSGPHGMKIPPEVLLKKAFATGDEMGALQLAELAEATRFLPAREFMSPEQLGAADLDMGLMMEAQGRLMRIMAGRSVKEVLDPVTQETRRVVSRSSANQFLDDAGELLERFPEVRQSLETAVSSEDALQIWLRRLKNPTELMTPHGRAIKNLVAHDSTVDTIRLAVGSANPIEALTELVPFAAASGSAGRDDLGAAMLDFIVRNATQANGNLSLKRLVDGLAEPIRPGLPSLRQFMEGANLITLVEAARLDQLVEAAQRVATAMTVRATGEQTVDSAGPILDTVISMFGSILGRQALRQVEGLFPASGGLTGTTLIVAGKSASAARAFLDRIPVGKTRDLLVNAVRGDPITPGGEPFSLLKLMLESGGTEGKIAQRYLMLHAYAWQAGLLGVQDAAEGVPQPVDDPDAEIDALLRTLPPGR